MSQWLALWLSVCPLCQLRCDRRWSDMRPSGAEFVDASPRGTRCRRQPDRPRSRVDRPSISLQGALSARRCLYGVNPAVQWHKFCQAGLGLSALILAYSRYCDSAQAMLDGDVPEVAVERGQRKQRDMLDAFVDHVMSLLCLHLSQCVLLPIRRMAWWSRSTNTLRTR